MILRNWQLQFTASTVLCSPKFPLALKSLTSRTILRKQQGLQTTITMIAWGHQRYPETFPGQMKQRPKCSRRPKFVPGKMVWGSETQRKETAGLWGDGRLAALGHVPDCVYLGPLLRSPFSQAPEQTAQDAEVGLSYLEATLVSHWTRHPPPSSPWGRAYGRGTTPRCCVSVQKPPDHAGTYQKSCMILWLGVKKVVILCVSHSRNIGTHLLYEPTNRASGSRKGDAPPSVVPLCWGGWTPVNELLSWGWPGPETDLCEIVTGQKWVNGIFYNG